jgi:hypothetical protein
MSTFVTAELDNFIPLIIGVFWIIAQVAGNSKKKSKPGNRPAPDRPEKSRMNSLNELMQQLSDAQEVTIPPPPQPVEIKRQPEPIKSTAQPFAVPHTPKPVVKAPEIIEIPEVAIRPTMSAFRNSMPTMKLPSMKLHFQCATHHDRDVDSGKKMGFDTKLGLTDRTAIRSAMVNHIILGKPKAFGG